MTVQLDPVLFGPPDETDEERRMREAREAATAAAQQVAARPLPLPNASAPPTQASLIGGETNDRAQEAAEWLADPHAFEGPGARPQAVPVPSSVPARAQPQAPTQPPRSAPAAPPSPRTVDFGEPVAIAGAQAAPELGRSLGSPVPSQREQLVSLLKARQQKTQPAATPGPDYTGADWSDAIRRPLHNLANALRAAGGRAPNRQFRSEREALEARVVQDATRRQAAEREGQQRALQRERLDLEREQITAQGADRDAQRAAQERIAQMRSQGQGNELRTVQADQLRQQLARNVAMRDSASQESQIARDDFARDMAVMQGLGWRPPRVLAEALPTMSGEQIESTRNSGAMQSVYRRYGIRGRGGPGGGGGGGGGGMSPEQATQLRQQLDAADVPSAAYDLSTRRGRERAQQELLMRTRRGGAGEGVELLPGIYAADYTSAPEARSFRQGFAEVGTRMDSLTALERVARRHGAAAVINPRVQSEVGPFIMTLRGAATELQNTGTINQGEAPVINAVLPDPTSWRGRTIGDLQAAMRAWRERLEGGVMRRAQSLGVSDPAQLQQLRRQLRSMMPGGGGRSAGGDGVRVRINGVVRPNPVPRARLDAFRARARERGDRFEVLE